MHTLWEKLRMPLPQHVFFTSTSQKIRQRRKKTTGLVLMSSHLSVEHKKKRLLQPKLWANQLNVIYSAYSLTRSTSSSQHGQLPITPATQDMVVWSLFVCHSVFIMSPVFTFLLTCVCVAQAAGQWIMRTKLKHMIASLSVLVSGWWL